MTVAAATGALRRSPLSISTLLSVLGVVYGDIGTSPLYAFKASLQFFSNAAITPTEVLGILSLIFWSLVLIVTVKYVTLIMHADNRGEGGILALMALAQRVSVGTGVRRALTLVGIVGACLFFGDGLITPAISVLSAVEGLEVSTPELQQYVLPISVVIIILLFSVQWRGTHTVGRIFGPVMAVWFLIIGVLGVKEIVFHPYVLLAISPSFAVELCIQVQGPRLPCSGCGGAVCHRGGGAVRRHGPFRPPADTADVDVVRAALPGTELFRPGRADAQ